MKSPFLNLYKLRQVAPTDSKPCFVCYKPTDTVLVTLKSLNYSKPDFLYICKGHLDDSNFCTVRYVTDDPENVVENKELQLKLDTLTRDQFKLKEKAHKLARAIEDSKSQLSKLYLYIGKKEQLPAADPSDEAGSPQSDESKLTEARKEYDSISTQLSTLQNKNRKYQLDQVYYQSRLKRQWQLEKKLQQLKNLSDPNFFPSVSHLPSLD